MHILGSQFRTTGCRCNPHSWLVIQSTQMVTQSTQVVTQSTQMSGTQVLTLGTHPTQLVPPRAEKLLLTVPASLSR